MRLFRQDGQTLVVSVLFMTVVLGMAAVVLDVGSWYRADRAAQATADAAALAAAQELPEDPDGAKTVARLYRDKNDGTADVTKVTVSSKNFDDDTITVELKRPAEGFFSKLFGIDSVTVGARASARVAGISAAKYVAPFAVDKAHPLISGRRGGGPSGDDDDDDGGGGDACPCFEIETELDLEKVGPGAFRIMNVDGSRGGTGQDVLADWIVHGLDAYMPLDWYYSDSGAKFNASEVKAAMDKRLGDELLFPVYDAVRAGGSNAEYHVVGWIGFHVTSFEPKGSGGKIYGWFTTYVAQALQATTGANPYSGNNNGVRAIALVD